MVINSLYRYGAMYHREHDEGYNGYFSGVLLL